MRRWTRDHGLLLANAGLFVVFFAGMALAGVRAYNADQLEHQESAVSLWGYLRTGDFVEATFENWESEFLQMGAYVVLTIFLFQKGSSESKPIGERTPQDDDPRAAKDDVRYRPERIDAAYWILLAATVARFGGELLRAWYGGAWLGWAVVLGGTGQAVGLSLYFWTMWTRIRPVGSHLREAQGERF